MKDTIKVIKLINDEEIVAELIESHMDNTVAESAITIRSPMLLDARQMDSRLSIVMVDFVPFTDHKEITVCLDKIINVSPASERVVEYYELMLEQMKYSKEAIDEALDKTIKHVKSLLETYKGMDNANELLEKVLNSASRTSTKH